MDMVVRKTIEEYLTKIKESISENQLFKEMLKLALINDLKISINSYEAKSGSQIVVYISVSLLDRFDKIYQIPIDSDFYDELGSLGGAEHIFSYKKNKSSIKQYELTNEFWDDIKTSIEYLKSITPK